MDFTPLLNLKQALSTSWSTFIWLSDSVKNYLHFAFYDLSICLTSDNILITFVFPELPNKYLNFKNID